MEVDFSIELGVEDPTLVIPWCSEDGQQRYVDLRKNPSAIAEISEVQSDLTLADFLRVVNSAESCMGSAKCDVWCTDELNTEEDIFEAKWKHGGYVDVFFADSKTQCDFEKHREFGENLKTHICQKQADTGHGKSAGNSDAGVEILLRRCHYEAGFGGDQLREGFYFTIYVFGYGDDEECARRNWENNLPLVGSALMQLSREFQDLKSAEGR